MRTERYGHPRSSVSCPDSGHRLRNGTGHGFRILSSASQRNGGPLIGYATERPAKGFGLLARLQTGIRTNLLFGQVCHGRGHRVEEGHAPVFRLPSLSLRRYLRGKLGKPLANCLGNLIFGHSSVLTKKYLQLSRSYKRNGDDRLLGLCLNCTQ